MTVEPSCVSWSEPNQFSFHTVELQPYDEHQLVISCIQFVRMDRAVAVSECTNVTAKAALDASIMRQKLRETHSYYMEHYHWFCCSIHIFPRCTPRIYSGSKYKICALYIISTVLLSRVQRSESVDHNHRPMCWQHLSGTGGEPASFRSAIFFCNYCVPLISLLSVWYLYR